MGKKKPENPAGLVADDVPMWDFADRAQVERLIGYIRTLSIEAIASAQANPEKAKRMYKVDIRLVRFDASTEQRGYLWAGVYPYVAQAVRDAWGYGPRQFISLDAHELGKRKFLAKPLVNLHTGELMEEIPGSTAVLDTKEMYDYIEQLRDFCEFLGGRRPPDPQRKFAPPPPTIDDGPDAETDREAERLAGTPDKFE